MGTLNSTPASAPAGVAALTQTFWHTEVRDPLTAIQTAADTYSTTPTNVTLGTGGTLTSRVQRSGKWIDVEINLQLGTSGAFTGNPTFSLPAVAKTIVAGISLNGSAWLYDDSTANSYYYQPCLTAGGSLQVRSYAAPAGTVNATTPFTWANLDRLYIFARYEAL